MMSWTLGWHLRLATHQGVGESVSGAIDVLFTNSRIVTYCVEGLGSFRLFKHWVWYIACN